MSDPCPICFDYEELFRLSCSHGFCQQCIFKYVQTKLDDGESNIDCPYDSCCNMLNYNDIYKILSNDSDMFERYETILQDIKLKSSGKAAICNNCSSVCKRESQSNKVYCPSCDEHFCFVCKESHYDYDSCENMSSINDTLDEIKSALGDDNIKLCPICKIIIQKDEGCASIRCKYCKIKFCWKCLRTCHNIKKFESHNCENYDGYQQTYSDDEYKSGDEYSSD